jgi:guanylate kinase
MIDDIFITYHLSFIIFMANGLLVVISSPSGGGKDSVINALLKIMPNSARFVTTTSRPPRPGNKDGVDYHFISKEQFENGIKNNEFLEYNIYSSNYYGTEKKHLENDLKKHDLVFTQIEVNGKHNLDKAGVKHLSVYLLPENLETLRNRIERRGGLTHAQIDDRLKIAKEEMEKSADYDYRIVNKEGKLGGTVAEVVGIIQKYQKTRRS